MYTFTQVWMDSLRFWYIYWFVFSGFPLNFCWFGSCVCIDGHLAVVPASALWVHSHYFCCMYEYIRGQVVLVHRVCLHNFLVYFGWRRPANLKALILLRLLFPGNCEVVFVCLCVIIRLCDIWNTCTLINYDEVFGCFLSVSGPVWLWLLLCYCSHLTWVMRCI